MFQSIYTIIITDIKKYFEKGSDSIIDSVIDHTMSYSKYNPLAGSSYIKLPKELDHPRKGLTNIQKIDDNECFKWSIIRYLNPANHHPARPVKAVKDFAKKYDFKNIKFPVNIRHIHKIGQKNSIDINIFGYKNKEKYPVYVSKNVAKKNMLTYCS